MTEFQTNVLRHFYDDHPQGLVPETSFLNDNVDDMVLDILQDPKSLAQPGAEVKPEPASGVDLERLASMRGSAADRRLSWAGDGATGFVLRWLCALVPVSAMGYLFVFW